MSLLQKAKAYAQAAAEDPNSLAGTGRIIHLICARDGLQSNWVGIAHENGRLYKVRLDNGRLGRKLRDRAIASRDGIEVRINAVAQVFYVTPRGETRIGALLDYAGRDYDVGQSVRDEITGEVRKREFPSVLLVNEDGDGDLRVTRTFGQTVLSEFAGAATQGDVRGMKKVFNFLRTAYPNDFEVDVDAGEVEPVSPEGALFYEELQSILDGGFDVEEGEELSAEEIASEMGADYLQ